MSEVASAYVTLIASARGMGSGIERELGGIGGEAGKSAGKSFGGSFGIATAALAATAATAIGVVLSKGIVDSLDISAGNDKVQASLGLTEKQAGVQGAASGALFAANYGDSMEDVNGAVGSVMSSIRGMRDASAADVESMTGKMMNLSAVMGVDVGRAAQVAGQMITSGIAKDGTHAADLLTASLQKVPVNVREDILDAVDEYGPFMKSLGIMGEDAMGLLVTSSEKGMYGIDKTGDALKEFGIRATGMSTASGAGYEALGMDQEKMSAKLLAGGDTAKTAFGDIIHGLQEMTDPVAQSQAALALFGTPLEDLSVTEIPNFLGALDPMGDKFDSVAGAADKMGTDLTSNAKSGFDGFKRQAEAALITFVQNEIMPSVDQFAGFLNTTLGPALSGIGPWVKNEALPALGKLGDWFLFVIPGLSDFVSFLKTDVGPNLIKVGDWVKTEALPALQRLGDWFADNKETVKGWVTVILVILIPMFVRIGIAAGISAAKQVIAWALASGGAVKAAIVYVAQSYIMIGRWIAMSVGALVNGIKIAAVWTVQIIGSAVQGAIAMGVQAAKVIASWVLMAVQATIEAVKQAAAWTVGVILPAAAGAIAMGLEAAKVVAGWVLMSVQATIEAVKQAAAWVVAVVTPAVAGAITMGTQAALVVAGWVLMATQATIEAVKQAAAWLVGVGVPAVAAAITMGIQAALVVAGWVVMSAGAMANAIVMAAAWLVAFWPVALIIAIVIGLVALIILNWESISKFTAEAWANVTKFLSEAWTNITKTVSDGVTNVLNFFRDLPGKIGEFFAGAGTWLLDAGKWILDGFLGGLKKGFEEVQKFVGGIGDWIAKNKGPKAYDMALLVPAGGWIMGGLNKSLKAGIPAIKSTLTNVSGTIQAGVTIPKAPAFAGATVGTLPSGEAGAGGPMVKVDVHAVEGMSGETVGRIAGESVNAELRRLNG